MLATTWVTRQLVFNGVVSGLVIGLLAMGIVLVYRSTKVLNFAVGNIGLIGATLLSVLVIRYHVPFWIAAIIALIVGTVFAALTELTVIRRLFRAPRVTVLVATIGIAGLALAIASALPSVGSTSAGYPVVSSNIWTNVVGFQVSGAQLSILVAVPTTAILLGWFLNRTTTGRAVHASADNPDLARLSGINPKNVSTLVWAIAGLIGTLALILVAGQGLSGSELAQLGPDTLARALVAAVIAGLVSVRRAMIAGVAIGVLESVISFNFINQPGVVDFVLFVAVLITVWITSRRKRPEPDVYPTTMKGRAVPAHLRSLWWIRHMDKAWIVLACLVAIVLPLFITEPSKNLLYATIMAYAICASSLTILIGWSGLLSLGQMAFAGLGALTAASLTLGMHVQLVVHGFQFFAWSVHPLPFWCSTLVAAALMGLLAAVVGVASLRVRGMLLAVTTFALALAAQNFIYALPLFGGGQSGTVSFIRGSLFGLNLTSQRTYYYVVLAVLAVVLIVLARLRRSGVGRTMIGVRDNSDSAASYTLSPARTRIQAFALAGAIAGLGGALLAGTIESVPYGQEFFLVNDSLVLVAMVVIGGLGSVSGAVIGAAWIIGLPAFFPNNQLVPLFTSSIGLLVMLLYFPGGFAQIGTSIRNAIIALGERKAGPPPPKSTTALPTLAVSPVSRTDDRQGATPAGADVQAVADALRVGSLSVQFGGNKALDEVSLVVHPREVVALIGANGAGKSTLMNAIGGYVPSTGSVQLLGQEVTRMSVAERASIGLGRTFQGAGLFPELTVRETVQLALEARRKTGLVSTALCLPGARRRERVQIAEASELIDFFGLGRYADRYTSELSTGTRRIVELTSLMAVGARLLCLDEPTAGVAQRESEAFGPLILRVCAELHASMLVIEHDMPLAMGISDRVYCLEAGQVIAAGLPHEIRQNEKVIASYLGLADHESPPTENQQTSEVIKTP
jgi:ABC-type branched-subunit amino acid transport system ATPase component/ABC-type branched-subunit amino acid transport system permease subunit